MKTVAIASLLYAIDNLMVVAARTWKYRPATLNGVPVRFVKSIVVNAEPSR